MWVMNVLWYQHILFVFYFSVLVNQFDSSPTCLIWRLHDPKSGLLCILPHHLKSIKVCRKQVSQWNEIIILWENPALLVKVLPHVIFTTQVPTTRKMIDFLETLHCLYRLQVGTINIKKYVPVIALCTSKSVVL